MIVMALTIVLICRVVAVVLRAFLRLLEIAVLSRLIRLTLEVCLPARLVILIAVIWLSLSSPLMFIFNLFAKLVILAVFSVHAFFFSIFFLAFLFALFVVRFRAHVLELTAGLWVTVVWIFPNRLLDRG